MSGLARVARGLFPDHVGLGLVAIGAGAELWPDETEAVARAIGKRQSEFAAGRTAARAALAAAGLPPAAIPAGPDRAPIWPAGVVGSITHGDQIAMAVAARASDVAGLGIDIEPDAPLPDDVLSEICDGRECGWIAGQAEPLRWARLVFAAKEAAFKCQYPLTGALFGFDAMTIEIDPEAGILAARFTRAVPPFEAGTVLHGRFARSTGILIAGFTREAR